MIKTYKLPKKIIEQKGMSYLLSFKYKKIFISFSISKSSKIYSESDQIQIEATNGDKIKVAYVQMPDIFRIEITTFHHNIKNIVEVQNDFGWALLSRLKAELKEHQIG